MKCLSIKPILTKDACIMLALAVLAVALSGCRVLGFGNVGLKPQEGREIRLDPLPGAIRTATVPVEFEMANCGYAGSVRLMVLGEAVRVGRVPAGEIIKKEMGEIARRSFYKPDDAHRPVAKMFVKLLDLKLDEANEGVDGSVEIKVEVFGRDANGLLSDSCLLYSKALIGKANSCPWQDKSAVPDAFYKALDMAYRQFSDDWDRNNVSELIRKQITGHFDKLREPEIENLKFTGIGNPKVIKGVNTYVAYHGVCDMLCNDYTKEEAKSWVDPFIVQRSAKQLMEEDTKDVHILPDDKKEKFNKDEKRLSFEFDAFTFVREPVVVIYDDLAFAKVIGDIQQMKTKLGVEGDKIHGYLEEYVRKAIKKEVKIQSWSQPDILVIIGEFKVIGELEIRVKP